MSAKKHLLAQFDFQHMLFNNALEGITEEEANKKLLPILNPIRWIAAHMVWSQTNMAKLARVEVNVPWAAEFARGTFPSDKPSPTLAEIKEKWNEINPKIREGLAAIPDEAMDKKMQTTHPMYSIDDTVGGLWAFLNFHVMYTIGQLSILRRGFNKEPIKFN